MVMRPCATCGSEIWRYKSKFTGERAYCRPECQWVIGRVQLECKQCGRAFTFKRYATKRGRRYCSHECYFQSLTIIELPRVARTPWPVVKLPAGCRLRGPVKRGLRTGRLQSVCKRPANPGRETDESAKKPRTDGSNFHRAELTCLPHGDGVSISTRYPLYRAQHQYRPGGTSRADQSRLSVDSDDAG